MSEIMISLSAEGFKKGDRCVVKAGRGEWFVGTIRTSGAKISIDFDDGAKATVEEADFKDVKVVGAKAKKTKATLSTQEAKAFREKYPASVIVPKAKAAKTPAKVVKAPTKAPKTAPAKAPAKAPKTAPAKVPKVVKTPVPSGKAAPAIEGFNYAKHGTWTEAQALCVLYNQMVDGGWHMGTKKLSYKHPTCTTKQLPIGFHDNMIEMGFKPGGPLNNTGVNTYSGVAASFVMKAEKSKLVVYCWRAGGFEAVTEGPAASAYWTRFCPTGLTLEKKKPAAKAKTAKELKAEPKRPPNVPSPKVAPINKAAKTTSAFPDMASPYPEPGFIFSLTNQPGEFMVVGLADGSKLLTIDYYQFNTARGTGLWVQKLRKARGARMKYTYIRKASDAEYFEATDKHKGRLDKRLDLIDTNKEQGNALGIQVGDVVGIQYSNRFGLKSEIVTDINHKTGKVAISTYRDRLGKKRRFIHMKNVKSIVEKGPGRYNETNPMYTKY